MNMLLIISGPTATGKTTLAVKIAKEFNGELISADSRQIYRGMDIGTGKDHPENTVIHFIDIIDPDRSFSVAQYRQLAVAKIKEIQSRGKLPIVVGGTGQYIDSIINPHPTFSVKPNRILRFFLNKLPTGTLQKIYRFLDYKKYSLLNNSDRNNPRRLIRKIEIKLSPKKYLSSNKNSDDILYISLTAPNQFLYGRIDNRVQNRLKLGLIDEINNLLKTYSWSDPGLNTLAYKEFATGFDQINIDHWRFDEHAYARRQKSWFKKITPITFIDITKPGYSRKVIGIVRKWYNLS
jgi:tRNA dimethylallyltransferase